MKMLRSSSQLADLLSSLLCGVEWFQIQPGHKRRVPKQKSGSRYFMEALWGPLLDAMDPRG